jgi:hypothetical protein
MSGQAGLLPLKITVPTNTALVIVSLYGGDEAQPENDKN